MNSLDVSSKTEDKRINLLTFSLYIDQLIPYIVYPVLFVISGEV